MQSNNQQQQQYSQHTLSSQQSQSSSQHLQQQEKIIGSGGIVADGSMANTLQGNDQVFYYWLSDSNFMKLYVLFIISFFFFSNLILQQSVLQIYPHVLEIFAYPNFYKS